jgi:hypothetical protein
MGRLSAQTSISVFGLLVLAAAWPVGAWLLLSSRESVRAALKDPAPWMLAVTWSLFAAFLALGSRIVGETKRHEGFFFLYRSMHLSSGVPAALPLWFLAGGLCYWAFVHFLRVAQTASHLEPLPNAGMPLFAIAQDAIYRRLQRRLSFFYIDWREFLPAARIVVIVATTLKPFKASSYSRTPLLRSTLPGHAGSLWYFDVFDVFADASHLGCS